MYIECVFSLIAQRENIFVAPRRTVPLEIYTFPHFQSFFCSFIQLLLVYDTQLFAHPDDTSFSKKRKYSLSGHLQKKKKKLFIEKFTYEKVF